MNKDQFTRIQYLIGEPGIGVLKTSHVVVVGVGGVGGIAAEVLVRSGIGLLTIVDFDTVDITNVNRQILATSDNVGRPKIEVLKERLLSINPKLKITAYPVFLDDKNIDQIIPESADFVIDAIDKLDAKANLIGYCLKNRLPFISSMGAGLRYDPKKIMISTINQTHHDPLAKALRTKLRELDITGNFPVVFSEEEPQKKEFEAVGSYMPVTSSFGIMAADYVIKQLLAEDVKTMTLAGGCFWGVEAYYKQLKGVVHTVVGYTDGDTANPRYEDLKQHRVNHVEACKFWYQPRKISLEKLLEHFFRIVNPTELNFQAHDVGIQYRNAIFFETEDEQRIILDAIREEQKKYDKPIVTILKDIQPFYPAEEYHQDYLDKNVGGYCHVNLGLVRPEERK